MSALLPVLEYRRTLSKFRVSFLFFLQLGSERYSVADSESLNPDPGILLNPVTAVAESGSNPDPG